MSLTDLFHRREQISDTFVVRVTARASRNYIKRFKLENGKEEIRVYVTALPIKGQSNKAVLELLAKELEVPVSKLSILHGHWHKYKHIHIDK